jgi:hypothetical protein
LTESSTIIALLSVFAQTSSALASTFFLCTLLKEAIPPHLYVEADLAMKEGILKRLHEPSKGPLRFKSGDRLLFFLESLYLCKVRSLFHRDQRVLHHETVH